jgi:hypothetical protein
MKRSYASLVRFENLRTRANGAYDELARVCKALAHCEDPAAQNAASIFEDWTRAEALAGYSEKKARVY